MSMMPAMMMRFTMTVPLFPGDLEIGSRGQHDRAIVDSLSGVRVERLRHVLIADLEHRVFDGPVIQPERELFEVSRARFEVEIGIDPVVPHDGRKRRPFTKPLRGELGEERGHEMVVPLNVESIHCLLYTSPSPRDS